MTYPDNDRDRDEPVTFTDKRRIDPQTGEVREGMSSGAAPHGAAPGGLPVDAPEESDRAAELLADLQRVQADFANYRKRALRDQEDVAMDRSEVLALTSDSFTPRLFSSLFRRHVDGTAVIDGIFRDARTFLGRERHDGKAV